MEEKNLESIFFPSKILKKLYINLNKYENHVANLIIIELHHSANHLSYL